MTSAHGYFYHVILLLSVAHQGTFLIKLFFACHIAINILFMQIFGTAFRANEILLIVIRRSSVKCQIVKGIRSAKHHGTCIETLSHATSHESLLSLIRVRLKTSFIFFMFSFQEASKCKFSNYKPGNIMTCCDRSTNNSKQSQESNPT